MSVSHWNPFKNILVQIENSRLETQIEVWAADLGIKVLTGNGWDLLACDYLFAVVEREKVADDVWGYYLDFSRDFGDGTQCVVLNSCRKEEEEGVADLQYTLESSISDVSHFLDCLLAESFAGRKRADEVWVEKIISEGDVNSLGEARDDTPLIRAARRCSPNIVQKLLDAGADVGFCTARGITALMTACYRHKEGALEIVAMLLRAGAVVDVCNSWGATPLMIACNGQAEGIPEIVDLLLKTGADSGLRDANGFQATDYVMNRVVRFPPTDKIQPMIMSLPVNPLHLAMTIFAHEGNAAILAYLVAHKMPVHIMNNALVHAVSGGHNECCRVLIECGADVNGKDVDNLSPLAQACWSLQPSTARLLIKAGARVDEMNTPGENLLFAIIEASPLDRKKSHGRSNSAIRRLKLIMLFIRHGLDINKRGYWGNTPLMQAVRSTEQASLIKLLLKLGSDLSVLDDGGKNIMDVAENVASSEVIEIIRHALDSNQ